MSIDLAAIKAALAAAHDEPWLVDPVPINDGYFVMSGFDFVAESCTQENADLVVLLRNSAATLVAEVERLTTWQARVLELLRANPNSFAEDLLDVLDTAASP